MKEYDLNELTQVFQKELSLMQFALEDVALCPFYGSNVKECNLFTRLFAQ